MIFGSLSGIILILFRKGAGRYSLAPFCLLLRRGGQRKDGYKNGEIHRDDQCPRQLAVGSAHDRAAARHACVHDPAHGLYSAKDIHRHPAVRDQGPGFPGRRQPVSGPDDRARVHHRHGQHRRRGHSGVHGRPGRGAVVLADRRVRHRDQVRRKPDRGQVPRENGGRPHDGRCDVRRGKRSAE